MSVPVVRAAAYVAWLRRHGRAVVVVTLALVAASGYLIAFHLPLYADFSYLLPRDAPAVRDFDRLAARMPARDTMLLVIVAPDGARRQAATAAALAEVRRIDRDLVERVESDDDATRAFVREHRSLFIPVADLEAAQAALAAQIKAAKLRANPMYVELDDEPAPGPAPELARLRERQRQAEAALSRSAFVSADGRSQVIIVRTAFRATDVARDRRLQGALDAIAGRVRAAQPGVEIGFTGGVTTTVAEHGALVRGVLWSSLVTSVLVALVLLVHLRSVRLLALLTINIVLATVIAFGLAALTVGHLNAATAFLGAIIAGNGINYGILLAARFGEERRGAEAAAAMATAIAGTVRPTLVASLGAGLAYGALGVTSFRGFADFALIGGVGMLVCWIASFVVLPLMILRWAAARRRETSPLFGRVVLAAFGFRAPGRVLAVAAVVMVGAGIVAARYLGGDPYEYDMTQLRSQAADAALARRWMRVSDATFGRGLAGLAGATYVAVDDAAAVPAAVESLHALAARDPIVGPTASILDVVPRDQARKLALLRTLRAQIDEATEGASGAARDELVALRPADDLAPITAADLPPEIAATLTERDGQVGRLVAVRPGAGFDELDGHDLIAFARAVRSVKVGGGGVTVAGGAVLFADVLEQIQRDGPKVTAAAGLLLIVMVGIVVGRNRRAFAVLAATAAGSVAMVAACAVAGLKINFLDFVALPITLGIGIDYAINVAERAAEGDPRQALRSTGGSVLVCSLTTLVGYGSLLVSDNLAIRGFGVASAVGEITCVIAALVLVPAIMAMPRRRRRGRGGSIGALSDRAPTRSVTGYGRDAGAGGGEETHPGCQ